MFSKKSLSLLVVLMVGFIDLIGIGMVYPMFASMLFQPDSQMLPLGTSDTIRGACLGILLAAMPITQFFSAPILGMLSDQKGRKKILLPTLAVGVIGYIVAMVGVHIESLFLLLVSRIVIGISAGTAAVVQASLADLSSSEEKAKNFALLNMACGLGFTVGPFLGGVLSEVSIGIIQGYALPFAVAGLVTLLNLLLAMRYFEETYTPKTESKISFALGILNIKKAFKVENLRVIFFCIFLACFGWSFYWEFAPVTWISSYGFGTATIGNFYAYGAAVYALCCGVVIRPILSRFSNQGVLCFGLMLCAVAVGMLLFHEDAVWLWFYIPLQQLAISLFWPTAAAVVSNSVSDDVQGEIMGVLQSMDSLAFAMSPLIAGPLLGISAMMPVVVGGSALLMSGILLAAYLKVHSSRRLVSEVQSYKD